MSEKILIEDVYSIEAEDTPLDEFLADLDVAVGLSADAPSAWKTVTASDVTGKIYLRWKRWETQSEYDARLENTASDQDEREQRERAEYDRLRKKFEGK